MPFGPPCLVPSVRLDCEGFYHDPPIGSFLRLAAGGAVGEPAACHDAAWPLQPRLVPRAGTAGTWFRSTPAQASPVAAVIASAGRSTRRALAQAATLGSANPESMTTTGTPRGRPGSAPAWPSHRHRCDRAVRGATVGGQNLSGHADHQRASRHRRPFAWRYLTRSAACSTGRTTDAQARRADSGHSRSIVSPNLLAT